MKMPEYFPHDCNASDDPKVMLMMAQLGLEAYGIYWILIEYLRQQPGYTAPLILLDPLSRRYGTSKEKFETIVTRFGLFECTDTHFFSPSLIRRMQPVDNKKEYMKELALKRWNDADAMRTHSAGKAQAMQSKVKKSIVKESIVKKSKEDKVDPFLSFSFNNSNELLVKKWAEWNDYRKKQLKKPYHTQRGASKAYNHLLNLAGNNSDVAIAIIDQAIDNEWTGFWPLKTPSSQKNENLTLDEIRERAKQAMKE